MPNLLESLSSAIPVAFWRCLRSSTHWGPALLLSAVTDGIARDQRKELARKIVNNFIGIFLVVLVFGKLILHFFSLNISNIRVGGGLLLAFMGWQRHWAGHRGARGVKYADPSTVRIPTAAQRPNVQPRDVITP